MTYPHSSILMKDSDGDAHLVADPAAANMSAVDINGDSEANAATMEKFSHPAAPLPSGPTPPPPPPNGGTRAWLQVLGAFFLNFNTWGIVNSYGVFQAQYSTGLLASSSASAISWIGSIQAFLMLVIAVLCGRALDAGYFYTDILIGSFLAVFGTMSK